MSRTDPSLVGMAVKDRPVERLSDQGSRLSARERAQGGGIVIIGDEVVGTPAVSGPFVNIESKGAVADGVTDCTAALRAALAASSADGGAVYVPDGVFFFPATFATDSPVAVPPNTVILFQSRSAVFKIGADGYNSSFPFLLADGTDRLEIYGGTFEAPVTVGSIYDLVAIKHDGTVPGGRIICHGTKFRRFRRAALVGTGRVAHLEFYNCDFEGIGTGATRGRFGIDMSEAGPGASVKAVDCDFHDLGANGTGGDVSNKVHAVYISTAVDAHFEGCTFDAIGTAGNTLTTGSNTSDGSLEVSSTNTFPSSGTLYVAGQAITYTGKSGTTAFTGCSAWTGTIAAGTPVIGEGIGRAFQQYDEGWGSPVTRPAPAKYVRIVDCYFGPAVAIGIRPSDGGTWTEVTNCTFDTSKKAIDLCGRGVVRGCKFISQGTQAGFWQLATDSGAYTAPQVDPYWKIIGNSFDQTGANSQDIYVEQASTTLEVADNTFRSDGDHHIRLANTTVLRSRDNSYAGGTTAQYAVYSNSISSLTFNGDTFAGAGHGIQVTGAAASLLQITGCEFSQTGATSLDTNTDPTLFYCHSNFGTKAIEDTELASSISAGLLSARPAAASVSLNTVYVATDEEPATAYRSTATDWIPMPGMRVFCANDPQWGESAAGANDGGALGDGSTSDRDSKAIQHCLNAAANLASARTAGISGTEGPADPAATEWDPADSPSWNGSIVYLRDGIYSLVDYEGDVAGDYPRYGYLKIRSNTVLVGESWATIIRQAPSGVLVPAHTPAHQGGTTVRFTFTGSPARDWTSLIGQARVYIAHVKNAMTPPTTRFTGLQKEPGYNVSGGTLVAIGANYLDVSHSSFTSGNVAAWGAITNSTGRMGVGLGFQTLRSTLGSTNIRVENLTIDGNDQNRCASGPGIRFDGSGEGTPEEDVVWNERCRFNNLRIINCLEDSIFVGRAKDVVVSDCYSFTRRGGYQFWFTPTDVRLVNCIADGTSDDAFAFLNQNWPVDPPNGFGTLNGAITNSQTSVPITELRTFGSTSALGIGQIDRERISWTGKSGGSLTGVTRGIEGTTAVSHLTAAVITTRENRPGVRCSMVNCQVGPCRFNEIDGQHGGTVDVTGQQGLIIVGFVSRATGAGVHIANGYGTDSRDILISDSLFFDHGRLDQDADGYHQTDRFGHAVVIQGASPVTSRLANFATGEDPAGGVHNVKIADCFMRNSRGSAIYALVNNQIPSGVGGNGSISGLAIVDCDFRWDNPQPSWVVSTGFWVPRGLQTSITSNNTADGIRDVRLIDSAITQAPAYGIHAHYAGGVTAPATPKRYFDFTIRGNWIVDGGVLDAAHDAILLEDVVNAKIEHNDLRDRKTTKTMRSPLGLNYPTGRYSIKDNDMSEWKNQVFTPFSGFPMPSGSHLHIKGNLGWDPWRGTYGGTWAAAAAVGLAGSSKDATSNITFSPAFPAGVTPSVQLTVNNEWGTSAVALDTDLVGLPLNTGFKIRSYWMDVPGNFTGSPFVVWEADEFE